MKAEHGLDLPRRLQIEFSKTIQTITEDTGTEISPAEMWATFQREYLPDEPPASACSPHETTTSERRRRRSPPSSSSTASTARSPARATAPSPPSCTPCSRDLGVDVEVLDYAEHAVSAGTDATAVAYVEARADDGIRWGVGIDETIITASLKAVLGAVNRLRAVDA